MFNRMATVYGKTKADDAKAMIRARLRLVIRTMAVDLMRTRCR